MLERLDRAGGQADERVRRQGRVHRPDGERRGDRAAQADRDPRSPERWIAQELVQLSTCPTAIAGRRARAAPRRPAAVRGVRRGHPHRPRRAHARRAARGLDDRQLLAGRRLEGHVGARGRRADRPTTGSPPPRRGRRRACPDLRTGGAGPASSSSSSSSRCSPGSPTSCTGSAASWRAPSTPRACSTASSTPTCRAAATTPAGVRLSWDALLAIMGAEPPATPAVARRGRARCSRSTPSDPASVLYCVTQRARGRAHACATCSRAEMWEAINTFHLGLLRRDMSAALRTGPYSVYAYVRERCGAVLGRDRAARCCATRRTRSCRRARAIEAGRHGAADAARRAARPSGGGGEATRATARRWRCCRRSAASRPTGARSRRRRTRGPVARFLLYERDYPDSVAASVEALHAALTAADSSYRSSPPVLRLGRLMADLDFRSRAADGDARRWRRRSAPSSASSRSGRRRHRRSATSAAPPPPVARPGRPPDALRDPLPHRVPLRRRRSRTTSTRCASSRRRRATQRVDDFGVRVDPETRLHQHLDYFGTTVTSARWCRCSGSCR